MEPGRVRRGLNHDSSPVFYISMDNTSEKSSHFPDGHKNTRQVPSSAPLSHAASPVSDEWATPSRRWSSSSIPVPTTSISTSRSRYFHTTPVDRQTFPEPSRTTPDLQTAPVYASATNASVTSESSSWIASMTRSSKNV